MTSSNGNIFRVTGHLCGEFAGPRWIPPHKGQWRGALMFSLVCVWINDWVNNRASGDLRRYHTHHDVIVMLARILKFEETDQHFADNISRVLSQMNSIVFNLIFWRLWRRFQSYQAIKGSGNGFATNKRQAINPTKDEAQCIISDIHSIYVYEIFTNIIYIYMKLVNIFAWTKSCDSEVWCIQIKATIIFCCLVVICIENCCQLEALIYYIPNSTPLSQLWEESNMNPSVSKSYVDSSG